MKIPVEDIREGDEFWDEDGYHHWTAVGDAHRGVQVDTAETVFVTAVVRFRDGGTSTRSWGPGTEIEIKR